MKRIARLCLRLAGEQQRLAEQPAAAGLHFGINRASGPESWPPHRSDASAQLCTFHRAAGTHSLKGPAARKLSNSAAILQENSQEESHQEPEGSSETAGTAKVVQAMHDGVAEADPAEQAEHNSEEPRSISPDSSTSPTQSTDELPGRPAAEVVPEVPTFGGASTSEADSPFKRPDPFLASGINSTKESGGAGDRKFLVEEDDTFAPLGTETDARFVVPFEAGMSLQQANSDLLTRIMQTTQTDVQVRGGVNARRMIIKVTGTISAIRDAMQLLLQHWADDPSGRELSTSSGDRIRMRLLIPKLLSGKIIGFRGCNIKAVETETGCFVRMEQRSALSRIYNSREVQFAGPPAALGAAIVRVLQTVANEDMYRREMQYNDRPKLVIPLPEELVGRIIGTSGSNLRNLSQRYGVSLAVSARHNFIPGTSFRKLIVSGTVDSQRAVEADIIATMREAALDDGIELQDTGSYTENLEEADLQMFNGDHGQQHEHSRA